MATTSLWHIEGRLKDLIAYVENPEKTVANNSALQPLWEVMSYVSRPEATEQGEYVSTINCLKEIALQQMILTKKQYGKENGYIAWHGYQSFKPDEVTAKEAHEIGLQTAREMWGDRYQIIVTTHLDKDHLHNHFCFNSVSFIDGKKYDYSKAEQRKLRNVSDRICAEHGLSVIKNPHKAPTRQVWLDEKSGKPTRYNVYREDVREAIDYSRSPKYIEEYLQRKGYITDFTGKHWKIRLPQYQHFTRLDTLDERWTPENLKWSVGRYASFGSRRAYISYPKDMPKDLKDWFQPFHRTSHIYRLYLHYCYLLGYLPKNTDYKPTSPYLKEDLKKLDEISEQVRYMGKYHIETFDDLYADRAKIESDINIFNTVQEIRKHKRRPTATGKISIFSGKVFCADCGAKLHYNTSNYHEERQDCFVCSNYRSNTGSCTIHYIRAVTLNRLVFKHIQGVLSYIQQFEASFVKKEREKADMQHRISVDKAKVDIVTLKRRDEDLDTLFKRIYEDMVSGRLSAERFDKLSTEYEEEQRQVKQTIVELQTLIDDGEQNEVDLQEFLRNIRKYTDPTELTAEILNDLVDKIVIHAPDKSSGHRKQKIEIYSRLLELSILPMRIALPSMADSVCKTERRKQPDNAKRRHSFYCTATLHKYFVIAPRLS